MAEKKRYEGSCHCGKVRYEVSTDLAQLITCNCSICGRVGWILGFVSPDDFTLKSGEDAITDYQFATKNIHHLFCSTCGIRSFGRGTLPDGSPMVSINVRCLDGVDLDALSPTKYDGKSH